MTNEVKLRKKNQTQQQNEESNKPSKSNCKENMQCVKEIGGSNLNQSTILPSSTTSLDLKTLLCVLSITICIVLSRIVFQQNARFSDLEEKYKDLHDKTAIVFLREEEVLKASFMLSASEEKLQEAFSASALATQLHQDIANLHGAIMTMQDDENHASRDLQMVNSRFLNVTETWQGCLTAVTSDLAALKAESREAHAGTTEQVNEAERRTRELVERLEELEDSSKRNARALERSEDEDATHVQQQLDWNTKQIHRLEDQFRTLTQTEAKLNTELQDHIPRAKECETHLPAVEEAVRSILKLGGDLSGLERRLEEVTLQVFGTEDNMLKALNEILEIRQELDALQAHNSIMKMKNELLVVKEAVLELTMTLREQGLGSQDTFVTLEGKEDSQNSDLDE